MIDIDWLISIYSLISIDLIWLVNHNQWKRKHRGLSWFIRALNSQIFEIPSTYLSTHLTISAARPLWAVINHKLRLHFQYNWQKFLFESSLILFWQFHIEASPWLLKKSELSGCWQIHRYYIYNNYFVNKLITLSLY